MQVVSDEQLLVPIWHLLGHLRWRQDILSLLIRIAWILAVLEQRLLEVQVLRGSQLPQHITAFHFLGLLGEGLLPILMRRKLTQLPDLLVCLRND